MRRSFRRPALMLGLASVLWMGLPASRAEAQDYPARTITLIVPSAPGGTLDALARLLAQGMGADLGRTVVVENVTGAGSVVGTQRLVRSEPDGYTIGFGNLASMAATVALGADPTFDPRRDLTPISIVAEVPMVIAASPRSGVRDLRSLVERIRARGEEVSFGTPGTNTTGHLAPAYLLSILNAKAMLVPYRGAGPAMSDLAAGTVEAVIDQTVTMIPAHQGRTAVALAVTGAQRIPQLPEVPTFAEAGVPAFDMVIWNAIAGPRDMPQARVDRLLKAIEAALASPAVASRFADLATTAPPPGERGPAAMRARIEADVARWTEVVGKAGLAPR
ncbi:Bug family tripartite tricarboxylate transporter substrate binding protein [Muricoccus pecuniae]|uniref:Tripartite-type tricarboxylate transporter receptor subunit TctC n=1 Tax=Muricoccus pecuniae TaxID=693023 RepID=A0A840YC29_9PROT|nr:tripartite tricarboxylate transporter substrate binding protein [Roseomonas pecuniae]MBB5696259.1 tripartite-type tricarboxylate transporter receptor subunit TctC [Roseomonas pecuniae]